MLDIVAAFWYSLESTNSLTNQKATQRAQLCCKIRIFKYRIFRKRTKRRINDTLRRWVLIVYTNFFIEPIRQSFRVTFYLYSTCNVFLWKEIIFVSTIYNILLNVLFTWLFPQKKGRSKKEEMKFKKRECIKLTCMTNGESAEYINLFRTLAVCYMPDRLKTFPVSILFFLF